MELLQHIDAGLAIKLASTALLVVVATGFAARFGAFIGAMIAAIPISAGPSYLFISMENDAEFVAQSALTSVAINPLTVVFLLIASVLVKRFGILISLIAGISGWLAGAMIITQLPLTLPQACLLNAVVFIVAIYLSKPLLADIASKPAKSGWLDIPLRVITVVTVVGSAVIVGRLLGPKAAGVVALTPVVWISMAAVIYGRQGRATCSAVLANGIVPMIGFGLGLAAVHMLIVSHGSTIALSVGLAIPVAFTLGLTIARPYIPMYNQTPIKSPATSQVVEQPDHG
ncbi:MAG: hypothetical protein ACI89J_001263 [Hyphomicrobiaceae bacterium]